MKRFSEWLYQISSDWLAVILTLVFIVFMAVVLPNQAAKVEEYAQGAGSPDTSFIYSPQEIFEMAEAYGERGRGAYVRARFTFDLVFPAVYGAFMLVVGSWVIKRVFPSESRWRWLNVVPVFGVVFDLLENSAASIVMAAYPTRRELAAFLTTIFTPIKFIFVYGSLSLVIVGVIWVGIQWLRKKLTK